MLPVAAACCLLPQAWQTVAAEYYDPHGQFSQAQWASQLLTVLKAHGGTLHTRADTYHALTQLVGSLGDKYSQFLDPSVRAAGKQRARACSEHVRQGVRVAMARPSTWQQGASTCWRCWWAAQLPAATLPAAIAHSV